MNKYDAFMGVDVKGAGMDVAALSQQPRCVAEHLHFLVLQVIFWSRGNE